MLVCCRCNIIPLAIEADNQLLLKPSICCCHCTFFSLVNKCLSNTHFTRIYHLLFTTILWLKKLTYFPLGGGLLFKTNKQKTLFYWENSNLFHFRVHIFSYSCDIMASRYYMWRLSSQAYTEMKSFKGEEDCVISVAVL